jgi:hypothetical protein
MDMAPSFFTQLQKHLSAQAAHAILGAGYPPDHPSQMQRRLLMPANKHQTNNKQILANNVGV